MTRRHMLAGALAAAAAPRSCRVAVADSAESLAAIAARHGRFFGAAVQAAQLAAEPDLCAAVLTQCGVLTPEIALTWAVLEPAPGQFDVSPMDDLVAFAQRHGKRVHGHNLLWGRSLPNWVDSILRETHDWTVIARFFGSIIPRYGDVVHEWNVVNEMIDTGHRLDGLRQNVFLDVFGPSYIARALHEARTFAPNARLLVNEFGLEYDLPEQRDRRYLLLKLLEKLRSENAPLDGFGMQSHLELGKGSISPKALDAFFDDVAGLGLSITITELDVKEWNYIASPAERDLLVGDEVRRYLDVALAHPAVLGVVTWGLSDRHSWLGVTKDDFARFPGAWAHGDGPGSNRGLPLDVSLHPTPMFSAIAKALRAQGRSAESASR